ncbi:MAG: metallophosphoesterase [Pedobacter sp.]|uniref:metallophosphoesterase n=1 Tax=Pedobacter sp. TaxID=1411316 RepID=UPI002807FCA0|nr:metallophosphoesterase [Pedobacter sp.]MDQ8005536.1 metallophosphoesterase [Pedobacter sp.]
MITYPNFLSGVLKNRLVVLYTFLSLLVLTQGIRHFGFFTKEAALIAQTADDRYFQIAVLADTQYYTAIKNGGNMNMFYNQIDWITSNAEKEKIAYVVHVGDITDHGDKTPEEWERAKEAMYRLEQPRPGLPHGIPYGVAVGNHDVRPNGDPNGTKIGYTKYFGRKHFEGKPHYGGSFENNESSDSHFDLFTANGEKFIVLYLIYNDPGKKELYDAALEEKVHNWGADILSKHADRKAIVVSHNILRPDTSSKSNFIAGAGKAPKPGNFTKQGQRIIEKFKHSPNVFMMLCGHISGEALREVEFEGRKIKVLLTDYQGRRNPEYTEKDRNGGNGILRLMKFNQTKQILSVRTFIPHSDGVQEENDEDSNFSLPLYK